MHMPYIYILICVSVIVCMQGHIVCVSIYLHACLYVCMYLHLNVCMHVRIQVCIYVSIYVACTCVCVCMSVCSIFSHSDCSSLPGMQSAEMSFWYFKKILLLRQCLLLRTSYSWSCIALRSSSTFTVFWYMQVNPDCDPNSQEGFNAASNPISRELLQNARVESSLQNALESCTMVWAITPEAWSVSWVLFCFCLLILFFTFVCRLLLSQDVLEKLVYRVSLYLI